MSVDWNSTHLHHRWSYPTHKCCSSRHSISCLDVQPMEVGPNSQVTPLARTAKTYWAVNEADRRTRTLSQPTLILSDNDNLNILRTFDIFSKIKCWLKATHTPAHGPCRHSDIDLTCCFFCAPEHLNSLIMDQHVSSLKAVSTTAHCRTLPLIY